VAWTDLDCRVTEEDVYLSDIFALLGLYAAWIGSLLEMFRDNVPIPSSTVKQYFKRSTRNYSNFVETEVLSTVFKTSKYLTNTVLLDCTVKFDKE
jgi:hypothetical protein